MSLYGIEEIFLRVLHYEDLDSTNEEAKRLVASGERGPLWIRADRQTSGRGRQGRSWTSLTGNLTTTGLYSFNAPAAHLAQLGFAAGLAVLDLVDHYIQPGLACLKWPNDVLIQGKKVAGVLLDSGNFGQENTWCAIGIGLNLCAHPPYLTRGEEERKGSVLQATHIGEYLRPPHTTPPSPGPALDRLIPAFEYWRICWERDGFEPLRKAWLDRAYGLGQKAVLHLGAGGELEAVIETIDHTGALIVCSAGGRKKTIQAGDIMLPYAS